MLQLISSYLQARRTKQEDLGGFRVFCCCCCCSVRNNASLCCPCQFQIVLLPQHPEQPEIEACSEYFSKLSPNSATSGKYSSNKNFSKNTKKKYLPGRLQIGQKILSALNENTVQGWRDSSSVKSTGCFCRGLTPTWWTIPVPGDPVLSSDLCEYCNIPICIQ